MFKQQRLKSIGKIKTFLINDFDLDLLIEESNRAR